MIKTLPSFVSLGLLYRSFSYSSPERLLQFSIVQIHLDQKTGLANYRFNVKIMEENDAHCKGIWRQVGAVCRPKNRCRYGRGRGSAANWIEWTDCVSSHDIAMSTQ